MQTIPAYSWGVTGHRVTGLIAEQYLTNKARKNLRALLGGESLAMATCWMDEIRSDTILNKRIHPDWHWVTIQPGETYASSEKNPNGDIIAKAEEMVKELKAGGLPRETEIEYLRILLHLVGDMHQPLHVGRVDDKGGNEVEVKWFGRRSDLHSVWDSGMIDGTRLSYTELAASLPRPSSQQVQQWQSSSIIDWAMESSGYLDQVYDIGNGNLSYAYDYYNYPLVQLRLMQAGVRLAGLLNEVYG